MMQMLGFRGGGSSSGKGKDPPSESSSPGESTSPNGASLTGTPSFGSSTTRGPARPLRIVYCDEKGKFRMDPEAVAALQLVKGPIGVVSVCGRARQGKSFILNQLLGRSSGFQVASTHRPCTKGLWMWSAPIKRVALDGTEYSLLLLDSEGIDAYDQTGTYSIQIFSLAVLLSSMFIYNQMGGIDEAALDRLSLVTEMTRHIRVRASGGRSTTSELGQFSPVFVWLLRDFYLDLAEDNHKITPRDYLELALRPMHGGGKDLSAKNEIRESIRALFPDRECFTLVRPLNNESELQRLDQISLDRLRPEFRYGLDALTKFVFERTKPKQVGSTVMTGPILAGITQSFLDALNNGAVPTISSSWQSVEEAECRRAFEAATDVYMSSFDRTKPPEEVLLREAHENAVHKSVDTFNITAMGAGSARQKYEKLLHNFFKKAFEDYKGNAFVQADLQCSNTIHGMEKKLRAACLVPNAKLDDVIQVLDELFTDYVASSHGPSKWQKLATFLQQCLDGPILDHFKRQLSQLESEKTALKLNCRSNDDKLELLRKQLEANERHRNEYMKRYEEAVNDKRRISDDYSIHISNLQAKCKSLEEKCMNLSKTLDSARNDSSDWKLKYEHSCSELKAEEDRFKAEIAILKSRSSAAEGRLSAAREQAQSAHEEALEWKRKYDTATGEAKAALERAALAQERTNRKAQEREDTLRAEFSVQLTEKDEELKHMETRIDLAESRASSIISQLQVAETKLKDRELEISSLKFRIHGLDEKLEAVSTTSQSYEKEAQQLKQEMNHLKDKYLSEFKKFEEADMRCRTAETEARRATELADNARAEAAVALKEKSDIQQLAMERLAQTERAQRHIENLEREKAKLMEEVKKLNISEKNAISKVTLLEERVEEREREMEQMLNQNNEQRSDTVQLLESLLATERTALAEANERAEALSLKLQATQRKLDVVHQELSSVRLNETALDSRLRATSHGKRSRIEDDYVGTESVQDMEVDEGTGKGRKRSKCTSPLKYNHTEDGGSVYRCEEDKDEGRSSEDYTKFTVLKLKQELTKRGFGGELLQLKNPNKKDILALYEKHSLKK